MSLDDIKAIDWKHFDFNKVPTYIVIGFALAFLGLILLIVGILL